MNEDVTRPVRSGDGGQRATSAVPNDYSVGGGNASGARPMPSRPSENPGARDDDRPVVAIMGELWSNTETLVRQELELGIAELDRRAERITDDLKQTAIGASVALAGLLTLVAAAVLLLANFVAPWVAALIVGFAASGGGYAMLRLGADDIEDDVGDAVRGANPPNRSGTTRPNEPRHFQGGQS